MASEIRAGCCPPFNRYVFAVLFATVIIAADASGQDEPAAPEAKPRFDVWEYRVEGNTVLDSVVIERAVYAPARSRKDH